MNQDVSQKTLQIVREASGDLLARAPGAQAQGLSGQRSRPVHRLLACSAEQGILDRTS